MESKGRHQKFSHRLLILAALLLSPALLGAQANPPAWPGLKDPRWNLFVHDEFHAVTSVVVAEGLGIFTDWPSETRYALSTLLLPVAQETFDYIYWNKIRGVPFNLESSIDDIVTYQSAWTVHFVRKKKWGFAVAAFVLPTVFTYARNFK